LQIHVGFGVQPSFECEYPGGEYSAALPCTKCIADKKLCGSQAIEAAYQEYLEKKRKRSKKERAVRQAERRKKRKALQVSRTEKRQAKIARKERKRQAKIARKELKRNQLLAALNFKLTQLHHSHLRWASRTERREQEYRERQQEEQQRERWERAHRQRQQQQQLDELLLDMNALIVDHEKTFAACDD
jgi:hypothetical protein